MEDKRALRRRIAAREKTWPAEYLTASDAAIEAAVLALPEWAAAGTVFIYVSVRREPETRGLIRAALAGGKRVAAPRCLGEGVMEARELRALEDLRPADHGLLEPPETALRIPPEEIDLAVIPCVAADRTGHRLGHGGGYYDRFLARTGAFRLCLCRGKNLLDAVPAGEYDVKMDAVVTEDNCR